MATFSERITAFADSFKTNTVFQKSFYNSRAAVWAAAVLNITEPTEKSATDTATTVPATQKTVPGPIARFFQIIFTVFLAIPVEIINFFSAAAAFFRGPSVAPTTSSPSLDKNSNEDALKQSAKPTTKVAATSPTPAPAPTPSIEPPSAPISPSPLPTAENTEKTPTTTAAVAPAKEPGSDSENVESDYYSDSEDNNSEADNEAVENKEVSPAPALKTLPHPTPNLFSASKTMLPTAEQQALLTAHENKLMAIRNNATFKNPSGSSVESIEEILEKLEQLHTEICVGGIAYESIGTIPAGDRLRASISSEIDFAAKKLIDKIQSELKIKTALQSHPDLKVEENRHKALLEKAQNSKKYWSPREYSIFNYDIQVLEKASQDILGPEKERLDQEKQIKDQEEQKNKEFESAKNEMESFIKEEMKKESYSEEEVLRTIGTLLEKNKPLEKFFCLEDFADRCEPVLQKIGEFDNHLKEKIKNITFSHENINHILSKLQNAFIFEVDKTKIQFQNKKRALDKMAAEENLLQILNRHENVSFSTLCKLIKSDEFFKKTNNSEINEKRKKLLLNFETQTEQFLSAFQNLSVISSGIKPEIISQIVNVIKNLCAQENTPYSIEYPKKEINKIIKNSLNEQKEMVIKCIEKCFENIKELYDLSSESKTIVKFLFNKISKIRTLSIEDRASFLNSAFQNLTNYFKAAESESKKLTLDTPISDILSPIKTSFETTFTGSTNDKRLIISSLENSRFAGDKRTIADIIAAENLEKQQKSRETIALTQKTDANPPPMTFASAPPMAPSQTAIQPGPTSVTTENGNPPKSDAPPSSSPRPPSPAQ